MLKRHLLITTAAAALAGMAAPASAVRTIQISDVGTPIAVSSDTGAYDDWAADCPNVIGGSGTCGDGTLTLDRDQTLFFWGLPGTQTSDASADGNSVIRIEWDAPQASETIQNIYIRNVDEDSLDWMGPGPDQRASPVDPMPGPRDVRFGAGPTNGFDTGNRPAPDDDATFSQGKGIFLAYGRTDYIDDSAVNFQALYPSSNPFSARVSIAGGTAVDHTLLNNPGNIFTQDPTNSAASTRILSGTTLNMTGATGSLSDGEFIEIELFADDSRASLPTPTPPPANGTNTGFYPGPPDGPALPMNVPMGYMDDIVIQLNAGPRLGVTTNPAPLDLGNVRAGTTQASDAGTVTAENAGTNIPGNTELGGSFDALTGTNVSLLQVTDAGPGTDPSRFDLALNATQDRDYGIDASGVAFDVSDAGSTGESVSATQAFTLDTGDFGGGQSVGISGSIAGPILGVSADDGARYLPYNSSADADKIDLGTVEIGTDPPGLQKLLIENLFGADLDLVTSLSLLNVGIDDASDPRNYYCILTDMNGGCASDAQVASTFERILLGNGREVTTDGTTAGGTGTDLPDMWIQFDPTRNVTDYEAILFFETDMNTAFGNTSGRLTFTLTGSSFGYQPTPAPASLALLGLGLAGLAGLRVRRALVRR